jgi:predicted RNA binding protein YcfA (HicA-like mRNA interferase family)
MVLSRLRKQLRTGRCEKLIKKAQRAPRGMSFGELQQLAECAGFEHRRTRGSHWIYKHPVTAETLTLVCRRGNVKEYQVEQVLKQIGER